MKILDGIKNVTSNITKTQVITAVGFLGLTTVAAVVAAIADMEPKAISDNTVINDVDYTVCDDVEDEEIVVD